MTGQNESAVVDDDEFAPAMTHQESPVEESPRPKGFRRFLRFNLLTVLILFLLVSAYFGIRQRFVVSPAEVAAKKTLAELDASLRTRPVEPVFLRDLFLLHGEGFERVEEIVFREQGTIIPIQEDRPADERLAALADLPRLTRLFLQGLILEDDDLLHVGRCASLETLDATGTSINDAGIERLRTLRELREIRLARTFTSDRSLEILAELPELEFVFLDDSTTERGIAALARWPKLKHVSASETHLRAEDVRPLVERGIHVSLPYGDLASESAEEAPSSAQAAGARAIRLEIAPGKRQGDHLRLQIEADPSVLEVQFSGWSRVDDEALADVLCDPRVIRVELPPCGPPYLYDDLQNALDRRPAGAPHCRIHGHVLISGDDLLTEARRSNGFAQYIPYDVTPELLESLQKVGVAIFDGTALQFEVYAPPIAPLWDGGDLTVPVEPDA